MPQRWPLRTLALSAVAVCATACAGTTMPLLNGSASSAKKPAPQAQAQPQQQPPAPLAATSVGAQLQAAGTLSSQGRLQDAAKVLAQLVLAAPDDPRVITEYGKVLVRLGRSDDAVAFLKRAVELRGDDWTAYSALGVAYDQKDDRRSAQSAYQRALALHQGDANVLNNYAVSRMLAGDYDAAEKLLLQAKANGSTNPKLASNLELLAQMRARKAAPKTAAAASNTKTTAAADKAAAPPRSIVTPGAPVNTQAAKGETAPAPHKATTSVASAAKKPTAVAAKKSATTVAKVAPKPPPAPALRTAAQGE